MAALASFWWLWLTLLFVGGIGAILSMSGFLRSLMTSERDDLGWLGIYRAWFAMGLCSLTAASGGLLFLVSLIWKLVKE